MRHFYAPLLASLTALAIAAPSPSKTLIAEEIISSRAERLARERPLTATFSTSASEPGYHAVRTSAAGKLNSAVGTVMFWYRPDIELGAKGATEAAHGIYRLFTMGEKLDTNSGNMRLWVWNNYLRFDVCAPTIGDVRTHLPLWQAKEPRHIAITWNCQNGIALYVNGRKVASKDGQWLPKKSLGTFAIGSSDVGGGTDGVAGQIVGIQIFDQALEDFRIEKAATSKPLWQSSEKSEKPTTLFTLNFENGLQATTDCGQPKPANQNLPELIDGPFGKALEWLKTHVPVPEPPKALNRAGDKFEVQNGVLTAYTGNERHVVIPDGVSKAKIPLRFSRKLMPFSR